MRVMMKVRKDSQVRHLSDRGNCERFPPDDVGIFGFEMCAARPAALAAHPEAQVCHP